MHPTRKKSRLKLGKCFRSDESDTIFGARIFGLVSHADGIAAWTVVLAFVGDVVDVADGYKLF